MSEYPEDVMKAANEVVTKWKTGGTSAGLMPLIARALMAERQRCADIARSTGVYPELNVFGGGPEWYRHGKAIAKAITSPPSSSASSSPARPSEQAPDRHQRSCSGDGA